MSSIFDYSFVEREHARLCSSDLNPGSRHIQGQVLQSHNSFRQI